VIPDSRTANDDIRSLKSVCDDFGIEPIVIGAMAYRASVPDSARTTEDLDVAVALDLDAFASFKEKLVDAGWKQDPSREERWRGPKGSFVDIIPAGPQARRAGYLIWPKREMRMSLVGFDHVFENAIEWSVIPTLHLRVIPLHVFFLLKTAAFLDDEQRRRKDLTDIHTLLKVYERSSDRLYSDRVFAADLSDIQFAPALLLGQDLADLCNPNERKMVESFLAGANEVPLFWRLLEYEGRTEAAEETLRSRLKAFEYGFGTRWPP
jgi:predicted nucleotidyltransferase